MSFLGGHDVTAWCRGWNKDAVAMLVQVPGEMLGINMRKMLSVYV